MLLLETIFFVCLTRPTLQRLFRHERTVDNALPHRTARKRVGHSQLAAIITLEIDGAALPEYGVVAALTTLLLLHIDLGSRLHSTMTSLLIGRQPLGKATKCYDLGLQSRDLTVLAL